MMRESDPCPYCSVDSDSAKEFTNESRNVFRVDTIFVCFNIDLDNGQQHCIKAFEAFAYEEKEEDEEGSNAGADLEAS